MDTIYKSIDSATSSTTFLPQQQQQQQRQQQQRQQQQVDDRPTTSSSQDRETLLPRSRLDYHPGRAELSMDSHTINDSHRHPLRGKPRKLVVRNFGSKVANESIDIHNRLDPSHRIHHSLCRHRCSPWPSTRIFIDRPKYHVHHGSERNRPNLASCRLCRGCTNCHFTFLDIVHSSCWESTTSTMEEGRNNLDRESMGCKFEFTRNRTGCRLYHNRHKHL